jgi:hypothetical protein
MRARVTSWEAKDVCPALWTRQEHSDGSVSYDGVYEVSMKFQVVGNVNAAKEFLNGVRVGQPIKSINLGEIKPKGRRPATKGRIYVFTE